MVCKDPFQGGVINISESYNIQDVEVLRTQKITIPSSEVLTLNTTPKQIVKAPGGNKAIVPVEVIISMDYAGTAYTTNTDLEVHRDTNPGDAGGAEVTAASFDAILLATSDTIARQTVTTTDETNQVINKGISVTVATGDPAAGTSDIKVTVIYRVIQL